MSYGIGDLIGLPKIMVRKIAHGSEMGQRMARAAYIKNFSVK